MSTWIGRFASSVFIHRSLEPRVKGIIEVELKPSEKEYTSQFKLLFTGDYRTDDALSGPLMVKDEFMTFYIEEIRYVFEIKFQDSNQISGYYEGYGSGDGGNFHLKPIQQSPVTVNWG